MIDFMSAIKNRQKEVIIYQSKKRKIPASAGLKAIKVAFSFRGTGRQQFVFLFKLSGKFKHDQYNKGVYL